MGYRKKRITHEKVLELTKDLPSKNFCPAPFLHTYINANNRGYKFCCMSKITDRWDVMEDLQTQFKAYWTGETYQQARKDFFNNKFPEVCDWWCGRFEREGLWHQSDRIAFLEKFTSKYGNLNDFEWDIVNGNKHGKPISMDLRTGKLCNLKCRSCNTVWSTEIQKEVLANEEIQKWSHWDTITLYPGSMRKAIQVPWEDPDFDILSNLDLSAINYLKMSGGESLIDPRVWKLLEKLANNDLAKNINLHLITNITYLTDKIADILSKFRGLTFSLSVDGIGELDEYLRPGDNVKWSQKEKVFDKIFKFDNLNWAQVMHVVQPANCFRMPEHVEWFVNKQKQHEKMSGVTFNPIVEPRFLHIGWLDDDHKEEILKLCNYCTSEFKMDENDKTNWWLDVVKSELNMKTGAHGKKHGSFTDPVDRARFANDYVKHQLALDKIRGTDTLKIVPEMKRYFDRYDPNHTTQPPERP